MELNWFSSSVRIDRQPPAVATHCARIGPWVLVAYCYHKASKDDGLWKAIVCHWTGVPLWPLEEQDAEDEQDARRKAVAILFGLVKPVVDSVACNPAQRALQRLRLVLSDVASQQPLPGFDHGNFLERVVLELVSEEDDDGR